MRTLLLSLMLCASLHAQTAFRPEFVVIHSEGPLTTASVKWKNPIYNLVGWKRADGEAVRSAKVRVDLAGRTETRTDESFPFEFSVPLRAGDAVLQLTIEAVDAAGASRSSEPINLSFQ